MKKSLVLITVVCLFTASCVSKEELEKANAEISSLESQIQVLETDNSDKEIELAGLNLRYDELESDYRTAESELSALNQLVCSDQIEMKYENIFDASTIIAAWWARQDEVESVQSTYRDHIWSNADTKIHAVVFTSSEDHEQYVEHFLIYFNEFGMKPGVFWVGGQCWLDTP